MKKQQITALFCGMALLMGTVPAYATEQTIAVTLNGEPVVFDGQKPIIQNDITWIPLRGVLETMGVDVSWNSDTKTITLTEADKVGILTMGSDVFQAGNKEVQIAAPVQNFNGSAMIPLRTVSEYFGADVKWDSQTRTIAITKQPPVQYLTDATYKQMAENENGDITVFATAIYPVLTEAVPEEKRDAVNASIAKKAKQAVDTYVEQAKKEKAQTDADGNIIKRQMVISYEDVYYGNGMLSYLMVAKEYQNHTNGKDVGFGVTFNLTNGKEMRLAELMPASNGAAERKYLAKLLQEDVRKHPTEYMVDAITTLDNPETKPGYYVKDDKTLTVFVQAGTVKNEKEGIVKVDIAKS